MPPLPTKPIYFGSFLVTSQVFHLTPLSFALVNLKPLLPGHVLVSPLRSVPRLSDLSTEEVSDLFLTVQRVGRMIERVHKASSLNVAMQDGRDAGQSVPHVHVHIIPRKAQDMDHRGGPDAIYNMLEGEEGDVGRRLAERDGKKVEERPRPKFPVPDEANRKPRSKEEMEKEAEMLAREMDSTSANL
ncbi:MAG: hypothetical protein MMC33_008972 [Icmadophila ericetorum]|nr:hypothetical protein [Icmadophila ericetorum]